MPPPSRRQYGLLAALLLLTLDVMWQELRQVGLVFDI